MGVRGAYGVLGRILRLRTVRRHAYWTVKIRWCLDGCIVWSGCGCECTIEHNVKAIPAGEGIFSTGFGHLFSSWVGGRRAQDVDGHRWIGNEDVCRKASGGRNSDFNPSAESLADDTRHKQVSRRVVWIGWCYYSALQLADSN